MAANGVQSGLPARRSASPETEAEQILAERFARGDKPTDDFLERASVCNWTLGTEVRGTPRIKHH